MIKKIFSILAITALSGCAVNYTYEGRKYESKEAFHQAVDSKVSEVLSSIVPLPSPVSKKRLIFAMPSESALITEVTSRFVKAQGSQPVGPAKEIIENIPKSTYKNIKIFYDAIHKKNIYASTQFIDMPIMTGSFEASNDADTLYYVEPIKDSGQWFFNSIKGGKQIFSYDRSAPDGVGKVQAFVDAVLVQAVRD
jgi:hypothetical protein